LYLYGGEDENSVLLKDLFSFESYSDEWNKLAEMSIPGRKGACTVCDFPTMYIIGGITANGYQNDIWVVNLDTKEVELLKIGGERLWSLAYAYCKLEEVDARTKIIIANAENYNEDSFNIIQSLDVESQQLHFVSKQISVSNSAVAKVGDRMITIGGEFYGKNSLRSVYKFDFATEVETRLADTTENISKAVYCYFKSSMYVHGGTSTNGNKFRKHISTTTMLSFELNENCQDCNYLCSPGTYFTGFACMTCPAGTYQPNYGASSCEKCPAGTFSKQKGVDSIRQCLPCIKGFFAPEPGSEKCIKCWQGFYCHFGSSSPSNGLKEIKDLVSVQPKLYSSDADTVYLAMFITALTSGMIGLSLILLFMLQQPIISLISKIDLFQDKHNRLNEDFMKLRKTTFGGLFSALFLLAALAFITIAIVTYQLDNIIEQKALVPLVSLEDSYSKIKGDFNITVEFGSYGGQCTSEGNTCHNQIVNLIDGVQPSNPELVCYKDGSNCHVMLICKDCELSLEVTVTYQLTEQQSYAEYIKVIAASSSSIPDEISSIEQTVFSSEDKIFRGPVASEMFFETTSSVRPSQIFESESPKWTSGETGFHIASTKSPVSGSESFIYE
jgi:hypothetical protein